MTGPRVSVVLPAYNREATVARAMRSVLTQSVRDLELIVVDDASTDGTIQAVEAVGDTRVRLLRHEANRRAGAARNTGIRAATGAYVAFLDSDDEWLPGKLERQLAWMDAAPEVGASCTAYRIVDRGEEFTRVPAYVTYREIFMGCDLSPGTTLVVRRDTFDEVGLNDERFYRYEDWDWVLRYAKLHPMGLIEEPLARVHRGGLPPAAPMAEATAYFLQKHARALAAFGGVFRRRVTALRRFEVAQHYLRERALGPGLAYFFRALFTWPFVRPGMYVLALDALLGTSLQRRLWRARRALGGA
jgi:glycosyltransferase involved in cell wall biosynthesis